MPINIFRGGSTRKKVSYALLYSCFIITGILLLVAGATIALDHTIAVKNSTSYVKNLTGSGSSQIETQQDFSFERQVTLVFSSPDAIQINVTVTGLPIVDSYSYDPVVDGSFFTLTFQGYQYLPVEGNANSPLTVVVIRIPATSFTVNVTVTEQTGLPRFVDAPGYFLPAAFSFLLGMGLLIQLAFRDFERSSLFQISPILRDSGLIAGSAFIIGLQNIAFTILQNNMVNNVFRILFPVGLSLVYLTFRTDLLLKVKQNILSILVFVISEYGIVITLNFAFNALEGYHFGFWSVGTPRWLDLTLSFLSLVTISSTGVFLLTIPVTQDFIQYLRIRQTKLFQVMKFSRKLERLLKLTPPIKNPQKFIEKTQPDATLASWRSEPFIQFILQLDFEIRNGNIIISRPDFGLFLLPLLRQESGFNLSSKPLWVPNFCAINGCNIILQGDIPFNACLMTKVKGYASQKFTPREIEIISIALFLRDGEKRELLSKIAEGTINVRFPDQCRGCINSDFIREEGPGALPDRPEIEIN